MAATNPLVLPAVIGVLGALCGPRVRAFVVPAAPNIAHALFFALTTAALTRGSDRARSA
jgi:hypothetical protein